MTSICIYTNNAKLFYLLSRKLRDEGKHFVALNRFENVYPSAKVLVTTQRDLDQYHPHLPLSLAVLVVNEQYSIEQIYFKINEKLRYFDRVTKLTVAIDPGTQRTGVAIFLGNRFILSKETYSINQTLDYIHQIFEVYPQVHHSIKLGNGYRKITQKFRLAINHNRHLVGKELILVNEHNTTHKHGYSGDFNTVHEKAAALIGRKTGFEYPRQ